MANHSSSERSCPALEADWTGVLYIQGLYHLGDGVPDRIASGLRPSPERAHFVRLSADCVGLGSNL